MRILVLDNYDSFTYNIVHILRKIDSIDISVINIDSDKRRMLLDVLQNDLDSNVDTDKNITSESSETNSE